jgi:hypothetical protein
MSVIGRTFLCDQIKQGRFAGTIGTDKPDAFGTDSKIQIFEKRRVVSCTGGDRYEGRVCGRGHAWL